jgi:hypothetical protein
MKKIFYPVILVAVALPLFASAAVFRTGEKVLIPKEESVSENLYVAGGTVNVDASVTGDLVAAGGEVLITGPVSQDALVAGGQIDLRSPVGGDVRVAGGSVKVSGVIGGDLVVAGGQVTLLPGGAVRGSVLVAGGEITLSGPVGKVEAVGGKLTVDGEAASVSFSGEEVVLGSHAKVLGDFSYQSAKEATVTEGGVVLGATDWKKPAINESQERNIKALVSSFFVLRILMGLAFGFLLLLVFRSLSIEVVDSLSRNFWRQTLIGFIALVVVPVAVIITFFTVVGIPIGVALLLTYIVLMLLGVTYGALFLGTFVRSKISPGVSVLDWKSVVIGVLLWSLIELIPFVGWIGLAILFFAGFGATLRVLYARV